MRMPAASAVWYWPVGPLICARGSMGWQRSSGINMASQNPFEKGTLFLFCGKRSDRCKGLLWMGTGFLLLYKRFEDGKLSWPRTTQEAAELTEEQYHYLMMGLNPQDPRIKDVNPSEVY